LRVCYFGTYEKDYVRNRTIIDGLRKYGWDVQECHVPLWERQVNKTGSYLQVASLIKRAVEVLVAYVKLFLKHLFSVRRYDVLMVGYIGHFDIPLAWILTRFPRRMLVFNPLISLCDTLVDDRAAFGEGSFMSGFLRRLDRWTCRVADLVLLDTEAHITYFVNTFGLPREKFVRVFVGVREQVFAPREYRQQGNVFRLTFVGKYTPLHGLHTMMHAAKLLNDEPDIEFNFIGKGQLSDEIQKLASDLDLRNIHFSDWVAYDQLPDCLTQADVCLGIFGTTDKAGRVIPGKVFWGISMGWPIITGDSVAIRELLTDGENALLCPRGDPEALSRTILRARADPELLRRVAGGGRQTYLAQATEVHIGKMVADAIERKIV